MVWIKKKSSNNNENVKRKAHWFKNIAKPKLEFCAQLYTHVSIITVLYRSTYLGCSFK